MKRIVIGCDEAAFEFKEAIKQYLKGKDVEVIDFGVHNTDPSLYPSTAISAAEYVRDGKADQGILMCGTGIGMAISANKVPGIRATVAHDALSMERSILSNDCQFICFGSRIISPIYAEYLLDQWLTLKFDNENSAKKIACITEYEEREANECKES
ncbi:RpiB/LacA/LacB family sugar-phosphate isomerase [Erysipelothrix sp. HDW6C]|uniref:RpiB/LacA/LacB family sugar-phosphate isomerase n=1 Tax=Erysipelothrix sp. HDW6C TaxID=2714930 RepID=UPI001409C3E5|nr:RpiB/LacA/LacB family sugar-phosphate isomerase [Erysipelothrix sp. HDW6C]QIK70663.1 RpiB/LacA/LacB family sugar-phosphate isomerase [Erysipelothrix sp. HDW6C]